jgi:hypothetical protein
MNSDQWKQVDNLLQACGGGEALETEVLESPAIEVAARAIARERGEETLDGAGSLTGAHHLPLPHRREIGRWWDWAWSTRPGTYACTILWLSSFCPMKSLATRWRSPVSSGSLVRLPR